MHPRAQACVFLRYPIGKKAYKVLGLSTKKIMISRDVYLPTVFEESEYPINEFFTHDDSYIYKNIPFY